MSSKDLSDVHCICRMCLVEEKVTHLKNMYNYSIKFNDENFPFTQLYADYTGIAMVTDEEISPYLCDKCETVLVIAFNFRKAVRESNTFLDHIFQKIQAYEETVKGVIPNDERGRKVEELKRKIFSNNYCRFCYMESSSLNQLFGDEHKHKNQTLEEVFKVVAKFTLVSNQLSAKVCKSCLNQMLQIFDGCMTARKNDAYIKKSLAQAQEAIRAGTLKIEKYIFPKNEEATAEKAPAKRKTRKVKQEEVIVPETPMVTPMIEPEFIKLEELEPMEPPPTPMDTEDVKEEEVITVSFRDPMSVKPETAILLDGDVESH